jgi:hypothetical protein
LVASACSVLAAASAAGATWSEPLAVSPTTQYTEDAKVAIDDRGDVAVVWRQIIDSYNSAIWLSVKQAGGSFSAPVEVSNKAGQNQAPEVALGPEGHLVVVWVSEEDAGSLYEERVMFSSGSVAGVGLSEPQAITHEGGNGGGRNIKVAIDEHGETLAIWEGLVDDHMHYATRAAGAASFSAPATVTNPGQSLGGPGIAIASNGSAVVAWTGWVEKETNGKSWQGAFAAVREAGGAFGPAQTLEVEPCLYPDYVDDAINDAGQAVVSWTANQLECESVLTAGLRASYRDPGYSFQAPATIPPQTLTLAGGDAVDPDGTVTVSGDGPDQSDSLVALKRMPDGSYGDREVIAQGQPFEDPPILATDAAGSLYAVTYTRTWVPGPPPETGDDVADSGIIGNIAPAGEGFATEDSWLQTVDGELDLMPSLATAGDGQAAVVWTTGLVNRRFRAEVSMREDTTLTPFPPATPEGTTPPPTLDPTQAPTSAGQTSAPSAPPATSSPTRIAQSSVLGATEKAAGTKSRRPQLVVRGRVGEHATAVVVRLLRGANVLRTAHAHVGAGHFRALLSVVGLPRGRYRMQILLRRGGRELSEQRWISLT